MPENEGVEESFGKTDFLYSITPGFVLVKKSIFGRRWSIGTYKEQVIKRTIDINPHNPSIPTSYLEKILREKRSVLSDRQKKILEDELAYRDGTLPETEAMKNAILKFSGVDKIVQRKIKAKTGIRIRWPWQSALVLHLGERQIDTPPINIDVTEKLRIQADTDYRYKIIDPDAYVEAFEQQGNHAKIANLVGQKLDTLMREYFKDQPVDEILKISSVGLKEKYEYELSKIGKEYGIEITNFFIKKVELPEAIVQAQAREASAEASKKAKIKEAEAKAEEIKLTGTAEATAIALKVQNILDTLNNNPDFSSLDAKTKMQIARTVVTSQASNATIIDGGFGNNFDSSVLLATLLQNNRAQVKSNPEPHIVPADADSLSDDEKKQRIKDLCDTFNLLDEDGYFTSTDSKFIIEKRGANYTPGNVISINDVTFEEVQDLAIKKQNAKTKRKV